MSLMLEQWTTSLWMSRVGANITARMGQHLCIIPIKHGECWLGTL